jgi:acyl-CoA synthetase (AMP-forming)/AMP-acid ligase II
MSLITPASAPASGLSLLGGRPAAVALIADDASMNYADLSERIRQRRAALGATRRLVMIAASNAIEPIVTYLAALEGGHPVLLVPSTDDDAGLAHRAALVQRFDPDVIARDDGAGTWVLEERRPGSRHHFHPELALLASTSGSTGAPKLVRLSADNLRSNAAAIAEYLRLDPSDRAATTLPMQYCYGLSVLNSHLLAGASLLLTERSVTDEMFWQEAIEHRITSFAGVPYTFELLRSAGFAERSLPSLRYLTQAGGRLAPELVRSFARLGEDRGFELFVMYGQTEATARMGYLPSELAATSAGAIGGPIPGGRFRIDAGDDTEAPDGSPGELVYEGPNVMLGYAESPADFALGRTVHELRTGDLARRREDGLYEIVGRINRFVKVFGLRLDLDQVERLLCAEGIDARVAGAGERLLVFATSERAARRAQERASALTGVPAHVIGSYAVAEFPRTSSGKPDTAALVRFAELQDRAAAEPTSEPGDAGAAGVGGVRPDEVRDLFAMLLSRPAASVNDSFAGLGGDSLSYIEVSLRLEAMLGALPRDWPTRTARELAAGATGPTPDDQVITGPAAAAADAAAPGKANVLSRPRFLRLESPAVLRAIAIVLVVGTHADLFLVKGGAHLLLMVAGYNLARFQLAAVPGATRLRRLARSAAQLAVPAVLWIGAVALVTGQYRSTTALLVNNFVPGNGRWNEQWQFWFLESMFWALVGCATLFAVRAVDRLERRAPFGFAIGALAVTLIARFAIAGSQAEYIERYALPVVLWLIALGWLVARADTARRRLLVSVIAMATPFGFFGDPLREAIVAIGALALVWFPALPLPRWLVPVVATLAGASMFVYLTHWQVYPPFEQSAPLLGTLLSLAVGVVSWWAYRWTSVRLVSAVRWAHARLAAPRARHSAARSVRDRGNRARTAATRSTEAVAAVGARGPFGG